MIAKEIIQTGLVNKENLERWVHHGSACACCFRTAAKLTEILSLLRMDEAWPVAR